MPDRFLREGYLHSTVINEMHVEAREFFCRLLLLVDDFGCFDGRTSVIAGHAYSALPADRWPDVGQLMRLLHQRDLIIRYSNAGKPYIAIQQWQCGIRVKRKYPAPPIDVDVYPHNKLQGPFGRVIVWRNPPGADDVSRLLDMDSREVLPQPPEWRRLSNWKPLAIPLEEDEEDGAPVTGTPITGRQALARSVRHQGLDTKPRPLQLQPQIQMDSQSQNQPPPQPQVEQGLVPSPDPTPTTTPPTNGKIDLNGAGEWVGVTGEQQRKWQEMFSEMSIPDQLDRAAAWLSVNVGERDAIRSLEQGFGPFLVRWLLREARDKPIATARTRGGLDS